jgi:hypothetical protein
MRSNRYNKPIRVYRLGLFFHFFFGGHEYTQMNTNSFTTKEIKGITYKTQRHEDTKLSSFLVSYLCVCLFLSAVYIALGIETDTPQRVIEKSNGKISYRLFFNLIRAMAINERGVAVDSPARRECQKYLYYQQSYTIINPA